jgi:hypothetical protein
VKATTSTQIAKKSTYIRIQPKLVEELDENNHKQVKLQFVNSISNFKIA